MGVVYLAEDEHLHRKVALKVIHPDVTGNRDRRRRFLREARVAAQVTHPAIATVYEVGEEDGRIFIAMEFVEGRTLKTLLRERGRIPVSEALRIARTVARGLTKAHEEGIIHRDLKPDNVMVGEDEIVKILDFGLAKPREKAQARPEIWTGRGIEDEDDDPSGEIATSRWALVGTPSYMSPEQAKGRDVDERSDLFSLGVILYEMVTGRKPFKGETWQEVIISINRDVPPAASTIAPDIPPALDVILARCLDKDADRRFSSCRDLVAAIDEMLGRDSAVLESGMRQLPPIEASPVPQPWNPAASGTNPLVEPQLPAALDPASFPAPAPAPPPPRAQPPRATMAIGLVIGLVVGLGTLFAIANFLVPKSSASTAPSASAAILDAGLPAVPRAITEFPPPKTENTEAQVSYARAMQDLRDASISMAAQELRRAVDLDPTLAAAALRHILYPAIGGSKDERRRYFQVANQVRSSLSERDQMLLKGIEPSVLGDSPDHAATAKRMNEAAARFPDDAEIALALAQAELDADHHELAERAAAKALAIDPKYAMAAWMNGMIAMANGDEQGVLKAAAQCLEIAPAAGSCLRMRTTVEVLNGDCDAMEQDARKMVAVEPNGNLAYLWLARSLAAKGASQGAIQEVLDGQAKMLAERLRPEVDHVNKANVSLLFGDFATAEQQLTELQGVLVSPSTESGHGSMATLVNLYRESGDAPKAAKVAKEFLDKKPAWVADDASVEGVMILAAARGGEIPKASVDELRAHAVKDLQGQLTAPVANAAWWWLYAWPAETVEEARDALVALPVHQPLPSALSVEDLPISESLWGKVYQLAAHTDDALPLLKRGAASCLALSYPIELTQAQFYLGQALEVKGDNAGACAAYKVVLDRWGSAKPRSITAEKARARKSALLCGEK